MNTIPKMKGYKATDRNMCCRGKQFTLGEWYEHEGELIECASGFHFCEQPSGVWEYYKDATTRAGEIEAGEVIDRDFQPGTAYKRVARRIKFVREVEIGGDSNTGDSNTGCGNTGDSNTGWGNTGNRNTGWSNTGDSNTGWGNTGWGNTGNSNTGNRNTGDSNTGDSNTGNRNTGWGNTGDSNTGDSNTGNRNTGDSNTGWGNTGNRNTGWGNTGNRNTGWGNTGNRNTGNRNTGWGNSTDCSTGFFNQKEATVRVFDQETRLTYAQFVAEYPQYYELSTLLHKPGTIDPAPFKRIPGFSVRKLRSLHRKHLAAKMKP